MLVVSVCGEVYTSQAYERPTGSSSMSELVATVQVMVSVDKTGLGFNEIPETVGAVFSMVTLALLSMDAPCVSVAVALHVNSLPVSVSAALTV